MRTLEDLKRSLDNAESLASVVRTMKALAAVNIRQYERALESLRDYQDVVERGFQAVLGRGAGLVPGRERGGGRTAWLLFGSDQGMAGAVNERVIDLAEDASAGDGEPSLVLASGERVAVLWRERGGPVEATLAVPGSAAAIGPGAEHILTILEAWQAERGVGTVRMFFNRVTAGSTYETASEALLPLDEARLRQLGSRPWPGRGLPLHTMERRELLGALARQYLYVGLCRTLAEALTSENISRLVAMQNAERNIDERRDELRSLYHQRRQSGITSELLDIVSGFEALGRPGG